MTAPTTAMCTSFKVELPKALHDFTNTTGHEFKCALLKGASSLAGTWDASATNYGSGSGSPSPSNLGTDELANGNGYTTGGATLTNVTPTSTGTTAFWQFSSPSWPGATFTTSGALIYNSTSGNRTVCVESFGGDQTIVGGTFTWTMPVNDAAHALISLP